jgi:pimeloyl-ACP methyl ester carboxylesterase
MFGRLPSAAAAVVLSLILLAPTSGAGQQAAANRGESILSIDHFVPVKSKVPGFEGDAMQIYVRERVLPSVAVRGVPARGVAVFVHGAGTPAAVGFDVPYQDYSWMAYLARAGFDVFSMEMTGYGLSTRPSPMNDPCNVPAARQAALGAVLPGPCQASYPFAMTTSESDWHDLGAVVDYVLRLRGVERVSLFGWSAGGPRAGGYAARNPAKVSSLVLLAPAYNPNGSASPPATLPASGNVMSVQTYEEFMANWDRQAPCANQYDPAIGPVIWSEMMASDPVGATWGTGMRRAPSSTTWGFNKAVVSGLRTPTLLIAGVHDAQVQPARVREMLADLGAEQKVFIDLGCSSHAAMWERNHNLLFKASLEWLTSGTVNGQKQGVVRLGYEPAVGAPF